MNVVYVLCRLVQIRGKAKQLQLVHQRKLKSIHKLEVVKLVGVMLVGALLVSVKLVVYFKRVGAMLVGVMLVGARLSHKLLLKLLQQDL